MGVRTTDRPLPPPNEKRTTCPHCAAGLAYLQTDVRYVPQYRHDVDGQPTITCPNCGKGVALPHID